MRIGLCVTLLAAAAALLAFQAPSISAPDAETAQVDGVHSSILFKVRHFGASNFYGRFNKVSGTITTREMGIGSLDVTVDATSVDTAVEARDKHLSSPDFFGSKQFPTINFKSDAVKHLGGDKYEAAGTLTLHGVSKPMTVKFERVGRGQGGKGESRTGFEAVFAIKRSDFGMKFMVGPISDEVTLIISLAAVIP